MKYPVGNSPKVKKKLQTVNILNDGQQPHDMCQQFYNSSNGELKKKGLYLCSLSASSYTRGSS